jgi:hypothetical protein
MEKVENEKGGTEKGRYVDEVDLMHNHSGRSKLRIS